MSDGSKLRQFGSARPAVYPPEVQDSTARAPTLGLILGLAITVAAVVAYAWYITAQISGLRKLQNEFADRNRKDSLQLLRIQNDLNSLGLAMRDMLEAMKRIRSRLGQRSSNEFTPISMMRFGSKRSSRWPPAHLNSGSILQTHSPSFGTQPPSLFVGACRRRQCGSRSGSVGIATAPGISDQRGGPLLVENYESEARASAQVLQITIVFSARSTFFLPPRLLRSWAPVYI